MICRHCIPLSLVKIQCRYSMFISRYRNSYKHNLCLDMLQDGFHKAFCELFELLTKQKEMLMQEQGDSSEANAMVLEEEPEKLDTLKENLIAAETAQRRGISIFLQHFHTLHHINKNGIPLKKSNKC